MTSRIDTFASEQRPLTLATFLAAATLMLGSVESLPAQRLRMNWTEFARDSARVAAFERAFIRMKDRSVQNPLDPLGKIYQANIHDTTDEVPNDPVIQREWLGCQQAHGTREFLSWHRGYIFYFEKILRQESGDDTLNLPYWAWDIPNQRQVPKEFRDRRNHPGLFVADGERSAAMNGGANLPRDVDPSGALLLRNFWPTMVARGFSQVLENPPHDAVHGIVGGGPRGLMGRTTTAARDPIFWIHHCNIDRLWDIWLTDPNHRNPTDADWLDKRFFYRDADGSSVEKRAREVIDSSALGYTYGGAVRPVVNPLAAALSPADPSSKNMEETKAEEKAEIEETKGLKLSSQSLATVKEKSVIVTNKPATFSLSAIDPGTAKRLADQASELMAPPNVKPALSARTLVLKVSAAQDLPSGAIYRLYLHPSGSIFVEEKAAVIGTVALFGGHKHHGAEFTFPLAEAFQALSKIGFKSGDALSLTVVPIGPEKDGKQLPVSNEAKVELLNPRIDEIALVPE